MLYTWHASNGARVTMDACSHCHIAHCLLCIKRAWTPYSSYIPYMRQGHTIYCAAPESDDVRRAGLGEPDGQRVHPLGRVRGDCALLGSYV